MFDKRMIGLAALAVLLLLTACGSQPALEPEPPLVGSQAPDFVLDNALGGQIALSDFEGEPVFLFFHMAVG